MRIQSYIRAICWSIMLLSAAVASPRADANPVAMSTLDLKILSEETLNGTAGDYIQVRAEISNASSQTISDITTYLSLADEETKLPVDLEDWSAEKGLFIGTIEAGQTLPLEWRIHFVKPGRYSLIIIAETAGETYPQVSSIVHFVVKAKHNLNPGQVLPVALGMPVLLLIVMMLATYRRNSRLS